MSVIIPDGEGQVAMTWSVIGDQEPMISTFGIRDSLGAPLLPADLQVVSDNIRTRLTNPGRLCDGDTFSNLGVFTGITTTIGTIDGPVSAFSPALEAGTLLGNYLPTNCAVLTQKRTALPGRRNRGRGYLPSIYLTEGSVDINGQIISGTVSLFNTQLAFVLTDMAALDLDVVVQHSDGAAGTQVVTWTSALQIATQRRRMRR